MSASFQSAVDKMNAAELALRGARAQIAAWDQRLGASGRRVPDSVVSDFNRLRTRYAVELTNFVELYVDSMRRQDELRAKIPFADRLGIETRSAAKFEDQLVARIGNKDPGIALLDTIPPLKRGLTGGALSGVSLSGLGMLGDFGISATLVASIALAVIAVGWSASEIIEAFTSNAPTIEAEAERLRAFAEAQQKIMDSCVKTGLTGDNLAECIKKQGGIPPPPEGGMNWTLVVLGIAGAVGLKFYFGRRSSTSAGVDGLRRPRLPRKGRR